MRHLFGRPQIDLRQIEHATAARIERQNLDSRRRRRARARCRRDTTRPPAPRSIRRATSPCPGHALEEIGERQRTGGEQRVAIPVHPPPDPEIDRPFGVRHRRLDGVAGDRMPFGALSIAAIFARLSLQHRVARVAAPARRSSSNPAVSGIVSRTCAPSDPCKTAPATIRPRPSHSSSCDASAKARSARTSSHKLDERPNRHAGRTARHRPEIRFGVRRSRHVEMHP